MDDADDSIAYFGSRGFEVTLDERDLYAELLARGEPGRASFFRQGQTYHCLSLLRDGAVVARDYAHGETREDALREARRRFSSEQTE